MIEHQMENHVEAGIVWGFIDSGFSGWLYGFAAKGVIEWLY